LVHGLERGMQGGLGVHQTRAFMAVQQGCHISPPPYTASVNLS